MSNEVEAQLAGAAALLDAATELDEYVAVGHEWARWRISAPGSGKRAAGAASVSSPSSLHGRTSSSETGSGIAVSLYRDSERGRGTAEIWLEPGGVPLSQQLPSALAHAAVNAGPGWRLPPPAAPARVQVADPELYGGDAIDVATARVFAACDGLQSALVAAGWRDVVVGQRAIWVDRDFTVVRSSHGFSRAYPRSGVSVTVELIDGNAPPIQVHRRARRMADLGLAEISEISDQLLRRRRDRARAKSVTEGTYDIVLSGPTLVDADQWDHRHPGMSGPRWPPVWPSSRAPSRALPPFGLAMTPAAAYRPGVALSPLRSSAWADWGWFAPLVVRADARFVRLGLVEWQPGGVVVGAGRARGSDDPRGGEATPGDGAPFLTVVSDGTLPYGAHSRPFGDLGEPVRRFDLVRGGRWGELALDIREGALRGRSANGGVANLLVSTGQFDSEALRQRDGRAVLDIVAWDWLVIDAWSARFTAAIGLAYTHDGVPVTGGRIQGNALDLWMRALRSSARQKSGWYWGPEAIRIPALDVIV